MSRLGEHAVVLGASISGLLAARVLSEFYDRVTVVERDTLPEDVDNRRGVPQGRHVHVLLASGSDAVEQLFPGILDAFLGDGAVELSTDRLSDFWQVLSGQNLRREDGRFDRAFQMYQSTRPFLETHVRQRLRRSDTVTILDSHDVVNLTAEGNRITGVAVAPHRGGPTREIAADLVVDAMGRGARTPAFLESLGYQRPPELGTVVRVSYTSQLLRIASPEPPAKLFLINAKKGGTAGGVLAKCENNTWLLTSVGMVGIEPPTEWDALRDFAESWAPEPMMAALRRAEPIGEPSRYRYASTQWRRYDRMHRFPDGLVVFGDAICSFNPIYGQGMSVAALEALALRDCLRAGDDQLARRFFAATSETINTAWQLATGADLAIPEVQGRRTPATRLLGWYTDRVIARCASDLVVHEQFVRVTNLLDPPTRLMRPAIIRRVLGRQNPVQSSSEAPSRSAAVT